MRQVTVLSIQIVAVSIMLCCANQAAAVEPVTLDNIVPAECSD